MERKLIKIDRNGSKHFEELVACPKCGGDGIYKWGAMMSDLGGIPRPQFAGTCWQCEGRGRVLVKTIERTPEYEAKLAERRAKRQAKWEAEQPEEMEAKRRAEEEAKAKAEAEQRAKEEAERAEAERKARSKYMGEEGEKLTVEATYEGSPHFERRSFGGYGTETCYIHQFRVGDALLVWMTGSRKGIPEEEGTKVKLTGTVKEHKEYRGEKQTSLTRCKVTGVA